MYEVFATSELKCVIKCELLENCFSFSEKKMVKKSRKIPAIIEVHRIKISIKNSSIDTELPGNISFKTLK